MNDLKTQPEAGTNSRQQQRGDMRMERLNKMKDLASRLGEIELEILEVDPGTKAKGSAFCAQAQEHVDEAIGELESAYLRLGYGE